MFDPKRIYKIFYLSLFIILSTEFSLFAGEWREIKSDHFVVYWQKAPAEFAKSALDRAEDIYRKTAMTLGITRFKGWTWSKRVNIYIYNSAEDYRSLAGYGWSAGVVSPDKRTISTYPSAQGFFDSLLPHELGHVIFREYLGPKAAIPLWLNEGVAMLEEEGGRVGADEDVRKALDDGRFIPLKELGGVVLTDGTDPELVKLFYAEAASVTAFLINTGEIYRFQRLCFFLKDGTRFEWALKRAYMSYQTITDLDKAWRKSLGNEEK